MGTNYYAMRIPTEKVKEEMRDAIEKEEWGRLISLIPTKIHIGKSSMGWVFHFNHNNWEYYSNTKDSLDKFLRACAIEDEYYRTITVDDFWSMVKVKEKHSHSEYSEIHDGLEFSTSTEFS